MTQIDRGQGSLLGTGLYQTTGNTRVSTAQGPLLIRQILTVVHIRTACGLCKAVGLVIPCRAYWPLREAVRLGSSYVSLRSESSGQIAWNIPKGSRQLCKQSLGTQKVSRDV